MQSGTSARRQQPRQLWLAINAQRWSAARVLKHFSIVTPAVDVLRIARGVDAEVHFVRGANWDGALESSPDGEARIFIDATKSPARQRFTIAHELGHLLLHRPGLVFRDDLSTEGTDPAEVQANQFAADLLMPRAMIEPLLANGSNRIDGLADLFQVSARAMEVRLTSLGYRLQQR